MKAKKVSELMIPLSDYATVSETDNLGAAIKVLKQAQADPKFKHKHRAVLVYDADNHVTGKLSFRDILKALEPKYRHFQNPEHACNVDLSRFGLDSAFLNSLVDHLGLWDESMEELVKNASKQKVKDIMYTPSKGEYVNHDTPLAEAIHQFILGCHQALLVLEENKVVGILRLAELFDDVCEHID